jgi:hypothetical protein
MHTGWSIVDQRWSPPDQGVTGILTSLTRLTGHLVTVTNG